MQPIDDRIIEARQNPDLLEPMIADYERFILASAADVSRHHVSKSDDEWSVALIAFYDAVRTYDAVKGRFLSYARLMIRSRLIDYFRSQGRHHNQVSLELVEDQSLAAQTPDFGLKDEIDAISDVLANYHISFDELARCSPKAEKTKKACAAVIRFLLDTPLLVSRMRQTRTLPVSIIEKNVPVPRKILERHRKYIVTAVEILSGDYPYLSEYLAFIKRGAKE